MSVLSFSFKARGRILPEVYSFYWGKILLQQKRTFGVNWGREETPPGCLNLLLTSVLVFQVVKVGLIESGPSPTGECLFGTHFTNRAPRSKMYLLGFTCWQCSVIIPVSWLVSRSRGGCGCELGRPLHVSPLPWLPRRDDQRGGHSPLLPFHGQRPYSTRVNYFFVSHFFSFLPSFSFISPLWAF